MSSPVPRHERRTLSSCQRNPRAQEVQQPDGADPRWSLLDLVRTCRDRLGLRDRDVTVLRGLLSLVPGSARPHEWIVFASNRVLIERCDGIDERTLRRRLEHLRTGGLLARRSSPNGKRYQVRDDAAEIRLTYGIDLSPLFMIRGHLQALAAQCRQDALRCKALRSVIRDLLFHSSHLLAPDLAETAYRALRRALSSDDLQAIVDKLREETCASHSQEARETSVLTASDSQNDRHIQNSNKEDLDSERVRTSGVTEILPDRGPVTNAKKAEDITVGECMSLAPNAATFACEPTRDWDSVVKLSTQLAPAIGLQTGDIETARSSMGVLGCALAVIGLVESFGRIRNPRAYLRSLAKRAQLEDLDPIRMFRSLTTQASIRRGWRVPDVYPGKPDAAVGTCILG
ncbi:replication initiation protein RepC [Gemmobacter aquatilis]|uniref:Replication initiation protein RepC n=1 Tax=Gemmobacter aquatilis TaxID=933059 RepID=A0A1H8MZ65_9RHOB|nr:plasmid replication protein RepC [Gemmobacter aquatilis]SEO22647.1 replication initiation protein RepC [Gemmobacter aquatilis]